MSLLSSRVCNVALIMVVALFITACGSATIRGTLSHNSKAIGNAPLLLIEENSGAVKQQTQTDDNGHYVFQGVPKGSYEVTFRFHETRKDQNCAVTTPVFVAGDEEKTVDVLVPTGGLAGDLMSIMSLTTITCE
ncbi:MAG: carboxypeptidase regulatory-like domain-containing protein [Caldilineaceae bacterium]|nr:carboxypeptidase regulatory-like domain-containing protein [Caldilineaceae bacterium]